MAIGRLYNLIQPSPKEAIKSSEIILGLKYHSSHISNTNDCRWNHQIIREELNLNTTVQVIANTKKTAANYAKSKRPTDFSYSFINNDCKSEHIPYFNEYIRLWINALYCRRSVLKQSENNRNSN